MDLTILGELLTPTRVIIMLLGIVPMVIGQMMYVNNGGNPETKQRGGNLAMLGSVFASVVIISVVGVFAMTNIFNQ